MSSKFNISINVDLSKYPEIAKAADPEQEARRIIIDTLLHPAKQQAKQELHRVRLDKTMPDEDKMALMARQLKATMVEVMAEANLEVTSLPPGTNINTSFPFED